MFRKLLFVALATTTTAGACTLSAELRQQVRTRESQYGIPSGLLYALIKKESSFCQSARSRAGAVGLGQLLPSTARLMGVNPYDAKDNIRGSAMYLSQQYRKFGSWDLALAAYNAGPGNVSRYGGIPPFRETQHYVLTVNRYHAEFTGAAVVNTAASRQ